MTQPGTDLASQSDFDTGLDDLGNDLIVPRLRIKHKLGVFQSDGTGQQFPELICVILGLVRQRVLFHHVVEDGDMPMCKSPDFQYGYPNFDPPRKETVFPWDRAKLNPNDFPPDEDGNVAIPCQSCALKEWGTHPVTSKAPYCAEQHTLPIYFAESVEELLADQFYPALITVQKTGIAPSKRYLGTFKQRGVGAYTVITKITLLQQKRGQNDYCVPQFQQIGTTPQEKWTKYSEDYAGTRMFLTSARPRTSGDDPTNTQSAPTDSASAATTPPVQTMQRPQPTAAPVAAQSNVPPITIDSDDELPF
jgi:hypothetical protein